MKPITTSHRYAFITLGLWSVLFIGYLLGRSDRDADLVPRDHPAQSNAHAAPSATVDTWQTFPLRPTESTPGRHGTIRVGRNADGLVITGEVDGPDPVWAKAGHSVRWNDHVEVALADGTPAELPPIGWGHQFEFDYMQSADDTQGLEREPPKHQEKAAAARRAWYEAQLPYRELVMKLFERRWRIAPNHAEEFAATEAFAELSPTDQKDLSVLAVRGTPVATFARNAGSTYAFEILIPWEAFPPIRSLTLQDLRLLVTVVSKDQTTGFSPENPNYQFSHTSTINYSADLIPIRLFTGREYTLTPCRFALSDALVPSSGGEPFSPSDKAVRYIRPGRSSDLNLVVVMDNTALGYQYEPKPTSRSPVAKEAHFWSRPLPDGSLLGGPHLTWCRNGTTVKSDFIVRDGSALELRREPSGDFLLKYGPLETSSYFGTGQCGGCPIIGLDLYHLRVADHTILNPLSVGTVVNSDADLTISTDWNRATLYEERFDQSTGAYRWHQIDHVRSPDGVSYLAQPTRIITAPPEPRAFNFGEGK